MAIADSPRLPRVMGAALSALDRLLDGDRTALIMAYSLIPFFLALKVYLYFWYVARDTDPLDAVPLTQLPLLLASDMLLCTLLAGLYWCLLRLFSLVPAGRAMALATMTGINGFIILFAVISLKVNQQYGSPLTMGHLRLADDLATMRGSILESADIHVMIALALGVAALALTYRLRHALHVNWHIKRFIVWPLLVGTAGLLGLGSLSAFSGVYTYGIKKNALVNFVRYYEPVPEPRQLGAIAQGLGTQKLAARDWFRISDGPASAPPRPDLTGAASGYNLLLIVLESTAESFIDAETTPHLHRMKQNALVFDNAFTTAVNSFRANYSVFYSDYMLDIQRYGHPQEIYRSPMPNRDLTDVARDAGYETAIFFTGLMDFTDIGYLWRGKGIDTLMGAKDILRRSGGGGWLWGAHETQTVAVMDDWLSAGRNKPFAAAYLTAYPHHPYHTPDKVKPFGLDSWQARFRNSLNYVDRNVGALLAQLRRHGVLENTIIAVIGDHGQTILGSRAGHGINMDLGEIQVPFFIHNARLFPRAEHRQIPASLTDVAPTLSGLLGLDHPGEWLGRNLAQSRPPLHRLFVHRNANNEQSAIVENDLLYVNDRRALKASLYRLAGRRMAPLESDGKALDGKAGDGNTAGLAEKFAGFDQHFEDWVLIRHLERACAASQDGHEFCPLEAAHQTAQR